MNDSTIDLILLGILLLPLVFGILVKMYQLFLNWFGKKLQKVYDLGYNDARKSMDSLKEYLSFLYEYVDGIIVQDMGVCFGRIV